MSGLVCWLTGLPSSGKSTLAAKVADALKPALPVAVLDGDEVRASLKPPLGYDDAARDNFYETLARLAATLARQGLVVLVPATAHRRAYREQARALAPAFVEVFVDTPLEECRRRDAKGLYAKTGGAPSLLPGSGVAYQPPTAPDFVARPGESDAVERLAALLRARAA